MAFKIKSASGPESIIVMIVAVVLLGDLTLKYASDKGLVFYATLLVLLYCVWLLVLAVIRVFSKPGELTFGRDSVMVRGKAITASDIDVIMMTGFTRKLIGIRPKGKRLVPLRLGFKFSGDEDEALKLLSFWAESNKVKLEEKKFFKWV